jgi:DNA primase
MSTPLEKVLAAVGQYQRFGKSYKARCPAHEDRKPSLSITDCDRAVLIKCHAGCSVQSIVTVLGLTMQDLFPHRGVDETSRNGRKEKVSSTSNGHKRVFKTAAAAVKQLEKKLGQRALTWIYHDADGNPIGLIVRWDTEEGKEILPVSRNGTGWVIGGMPAPRPLYRLPELV